MSLRALPNLWQGRNKAVALWTNVPTEVTPFEQLIHRRWLHDECIGDIEYKQCMQISESIHVHSQKRGSSTTKINRVCRAHKSVCSLSPQPPLEVSQSPYGLFFYDANRTWIFGPTKHQKKSIPVDDDGRWWRYRTLEGQQRSGTVSWVLRD